MSQEERVQQNSFKKEDSGEHTLSQIEKVQE